MIVKSLILRPIECEYARAGFVLGQAGAVAFFGLCGMAWMVRWMNGCGGLEFGSCWGLWAKDFTRSV